MLQATQETFNKVSNNSLTAPSFLFQSAFGSEYWIGMLVVGGVTTLYTLFGGFIGATYTDGVQDIIIFLALIAVPIVGITQASGVTNTIESIRAANTEIDMFSPFTGGTVLAAISAAAWGFGYFRQPHVLVRFLALHSPRTPSPS